MLELENLRVCYGEFVAVSSVSLRVERGECAALLGMNGAGKTSLLSAVSGLLCPAGGRVLFDGEDITGKEPDRIVRGGLSLVPQGGRCFERLSVRDNLIVGSYPREARGQRAASLERVYALFPDLWEKRHRAAGSLSGGQRQMLAIGRALMAQPRCLLFDEISLGLAPVAIRGLYEGIERLRADGELTVLLVEQDTERALHIADRCFVMQHGRIALAAKAGEATMEEIKTAYFGV